MISKGLFILTLVFVQVSSVLTQDEKLAEIDTKFGKIVIKLYNETPKHRDNFVKLVNEGYFNGQLFHRVINNFMIQGGDPNSKGAAKGEMLGMGGPGYTVPAELNAKYYHKKGALAAARKGDAVNPDKASSGSQFYIVQGTVFTPEQLDAFVKMGRHKPFTEQQIKEYTTLGGTPHLDDAYTVFGEIVEGMEVLDKIASQPVDNYNRPVEDVVFSIKMLKD
jgi:peptidyl-prolyl cis-trans isomerase B (cyclophilin B)